MKELSDIPTVTIPPRPYKYIVAVVKDGQGAHKFVVRAADANSEYHREIRAALILEVGLDPELSKDDWSRLRVVGGGYIAETNDGYVLSGTSTEFGMEPRREMIAEIVRIETGKTVTIAKD